MNLFVIFGVAMDLDTCKVMREGCVNLTRCPYARARARGDVELGDETDPLEPALRLLGDVADSILVIPDRGDDGARAYVVLSLPIFRLVRSRSLSLGAWVPKNLARRRKPSAARCLLDLLGPPGRRSGCWPHDGEVAGGAVADSTLVISGSGRWPRRSQVRGQLRHDPIATAG